MTWQSVTLETREPHDLFLVAATTAVTGVEIAVQLSEIQALMFGRILRDTVAPTESPRIYANRIGVNP